MYGTLKSIFMPAIPNDPMFLIYFNKENGNKNVVFFNHFQGDKCTYWQKHNIKAFGNNHKYIVITIFIQR